MIPLSRTCCMNGALAPVKLNCILASQYIYTNSDIDIQLVEITQHREGGRRNRLLKQTYLKCMSISVEEAIILATTEDIKLNTCLFT